MPLLEKELVVSEIRLEEPSVRVTRDQKGRFNFESLAVLQEAEGQKEAAATPSSEGEAAATLPVALTVDQVVVDRARVTVRDAMGEIPETDLTANCGVRLSIGKDLASLAYQGKVDFALDTVYEDVRPRISGEGDFDQNRLGYDVVSDLDGQQVRLSGEVQDWAKVPQIVLNIASERLDLDKLLALAAVQETPGQPEPSPPPRGQGAETPAPGAALPPGLTASGKIDIGEALYQGLTVRDFQLAYGLERGILTVRDLTAQVAEGTIGGGLKADLNRPGLSYEGDLAVNALQIQPLLAAFATGQDIVSGTMQGDISFSGTGTAWPQMREALTAEATYGLSQGKIRETAVTQAIAKLLETDALREPTFESIDGNLHIEDGKVALRSQMDGTRVSGETKGVIGLDGTLDLPVTLRLSEEVADQLRARSSVAKYIAGKTGEATIRMKLSGTIDRPRPTLDTAAVQEQVTETLKGKAAEELEKQDLPAPAKDLLKGVLGK
jgi:uncharacterized protein involved in outer membrane biogenesis